ncbi:MAG: uroporphyrinogen-III C-methyltransferase [Actinobacteria bacterium]|nr:uroporphyrinogen-III C-methyltransferase [Actinomycetota bacterium]
MPLFVELGGRLAVVVGGGLVAERRVVRLLAAGATVRVTAPGITPLLASLAYRDEIELRQREFEDADVEGGFLVVTATDNAAVNERVREAARQAGALVNAADHHNSGDVVFGAEARLGPVRLAVTTLGAAPAESSRIRDELAAALTGESVERVSAASSRRRRPGFGAPGPRVALVGAGPGDPGLVTARGLELLRAADVVVHDHLVDPRLLAEAPETADLVYVGKRAGSHHFSQAGIDALLVRLAIEDPARRIVRLKGGDPFVFGRGSEEVEALGAAGIDVEVVPGVTAGTAVPACAGIPITARGTAPSVTFVTGHRAAAGSREVDWRALGATGGTICVFMGLARLHDIAQELISGGMAPTTPAVAISRGCTPQQRLVEAPVGKLPAAVEQAGLVSPVLLVIGEAVNRRA